MDDFEDSLWDTVKKEANTLLKPTNATNATVSNSTQTNTTSTNGTTATNTTTPVNITETKKSSKFNSLVEAVISGYENNINKTQMDVERKKAKMQERADKGGKDLVVMRQQLVDVQTQIEEKVKEVEASQETIDKQTTALGVFMEQIKKNGAEKDVKLRERLEKELRTTVEKAQKQKKRSEKEQQRLIKELRKLYRKKKTLQRDIKEKEVQMSGLVQRIAHIEEMTELKVQEIKRVVEWMKKKLEKRVLYKKRLFEVVQSLNATIPLIESEFTLPKKKAELQETANQLKKVRVNVLRQIKNLRTMLMARVNVYNKSKIVRIAYEDRRDRIAEEEKRHRELARKVGQRVVALREEINKQKEYLKKQTVEVLRDIAASKLSELRGQFNTADTQLRKVQRKLKFMNKAQMKARKEYDLDMQKIQREFVKEKIAAFKKAKTEALRGRRRFEKRIERIEKAMTNKKYTVDQVKTFAEKAAILRKKLPEMNQKVAKAVNRLKAEYSRIRAERTKKYEHLKKVAAELKTLEDELTSEMEILKEKVSQTTNELEKSGLVEDLNDVSRRQATAHAKASVAKRAVEKIEEKVIEELKSDLRGERKMVRVLNKSKERTLKRINVLKENNEYNQIVDELQKRVEEVNKMIDIHMKNAAEIEGRVTEALRKRDESLKLAVVEAQSNLARVRTKKEGIADELNRILKASKTDSVEQLKENTKRMKELKRDLLILNTVENKVREKLEALNKVVFVRSIDEKTMKAARKSRELIRQMKRSSRKVRIMRGKLAVNKRMIDKLYKSVHETGDVISERAEEKMEQLKNVRELMKNKLKKVLYDHKKLQKALFKHVERVKRLAKYRIRQYEKQHAVLLNKRNEMMMNKAKVVKDKGTEYYYTKIDLVDEKMNDVAREEKEYKSRLNKRVNKMVAVAKECEKKTPTGLEGIKMKCAMCRNLAAFLLKKIRRDRLSAKEVMKKMYTKCESSSHPALCLRTALKLSTKAFQKKNVDVTPKELCYKVGRCVLNV
ncbi:hypothetical protein EIN_227500 [Entamoeba invadens IP1]|uniref:Uncharacterized protein n=1 Tax=Entamoeba invadens IP1 TaxID=370355 RepID=A0A0A1U2Q4_ENTIV|nr:hypothetical protein EIN_227500 [Entamoeba invadens IP1]ELP88337.1 hypothetical protein EIN_227500 [Entamoeba invadens IP1]|eukprot:XP_004255108.1 hypothetical protein EIN_227500 [Entamoeba invadens IP1]